MQLANLKRKSEMLRGWLLGGLLAAFTAVANTEDTRLHLIVNGVQQARGHIIVGVFDCEATYAEGEKPRFHVFLPAEPDQGRVEYTFEDISAGTFAIKLFHDLNDNQKLDSNWLGFPREPFGFSNNPRIRFGPPDFAATRFTIAAGEIHEQTVVLN